MIPEPFLSLERGSLVFYGSWSELVTTGVLDQDYYIGKELFTIDSKQYKVIDARFGPAGSLLKKWAQSLPFVLKEVELSLDPNVRELTLDDLRQLVLTHVVEGSLQDLKGFDLEGIRNTALVAKEPWEIFRVLEFGQDIEEGLSFGPYS
jgi:hypothetical protein